MDACTVEVGLLRKHPCGHPSVAKCANCEQPLCSKHALPQLSGTGAKTGKFLCAQCAAAAKLYEETEPAPAAPAAKPGEAPKPSHAAHAAKPAAKPAPAAKAAAAEKKPEPPPEDSAPLEFNPEPKKPDDKK
jgi:hypothetical protein